MRRSARYAERLGARMGLLDRLFGKRKRAGVPVPEHAVIVYFQYGSTDLSRLTALEEEISQAIAAAGVGEFDGNEVATDGSDGFLYMYGPSRLLKKSSSTHDY